MTLLGLGAGASTHTDRRPSHKTGARRAGGWNPGAPPQGRPAWCVRRQFEVTCNGLPSLPMMDLAHIASIWLTTFTGIGT